MNGNELLDSSANMSETYGCLSDTAGRGWDVLVAEKVMGLVVMRAKDIDDEWWSRPDELLTGKKPGVPPRWGSAAPIKQYSFNISHAWEVVERMAAIRDSDMSNGYQMEMRTYRGNVIARFISSPPREWMAEEFWDAPEDQGAGKAETAPLAICLAALKSVGALPAEGE